jgi:FkbM family methyltransferase
VDGGYEPVEAQLAPRVVVDGDNVLELGAGLGFISTVISTRRRPASYLAVEANLRMFPLIEATHRANGVANVELLHAVVTSDPAAIDAGSVPFWVGREFWSARIAASSEGATMIVPTASLNEILHDRAITVIIADIEGGEATLFDDADLSGIRAILIELHPDAMDASIFVRLCSNLHLQGLIYDDSRSSGQVVTFSRDLLAQF